MTEMLGFADDAFDHVDAYHGDEVNPDADTAFHQAARENRQLLNDIHALFSSPLGAKVLNWMISVTLAQPVIDRRMMFEVPQENLNALALVREGENELVRRIITAVREFDQLAEEENHEI